MIKEDEVCKHFVYC